MTRDRHSAALAAFRAVLELFPDVEMKGKKIAYTSLNGHMTSFLDPAGSFCLRLSRADMATFLDAYPGEPVLQYGAVMKEYVAVPDQLLADAGTLAPWFARSRAYVDGLKPKPTRRK